MSETPKPYCPECDEHVDATEALDRRGFIRVVGEQAVTLLAAGGALAAAPGLLAAQQPAPGAAPAARTERPAEALVRERFTSLTADQRRQVVKPWNHGAENGRGTPSRQRMVNRYLDRRIGDVYTPAQQELLQRILRAIASDEAGHRQLTRNGT